MDRDLRIDRVSTTLLDVRLRRPHRFARVEMSAQPVLLVAIGTAGGVVGHGEGVVPGGPWWGGESVETMQTIVERYIAPVLIGRSVDDVEALQRDIANHVAANLFAKAAVEIALHDAWARALGVPLYALLGAAVRRSIPVTWALGADPAPIVLEEALGKLEAGLHRTFKLKMGAQDPAEDVARVATIAEGLAGVAGVRVDLNARWDRSTALHYLPRLAAAGVELVEQPVPAEEFEALAEINRALPIPVMADESLRTRSTRDGSLGWGRRTCSRSRRPSPEDFGAVRRSPRSPRRPGFPVTPGRRSRPASVRRPRCTWPASLPP